MRYVLLCVLCLIFIKPAHATAWGTDCSYTTKIVNVQIPSGKKITIDPNVPVGKAFFGHYVAVQTGLNFTCQGGTNILLAPGINMMKVGNS